MRPFIIWRSIMSLLFAYELAKPFLSFDIRFTFCYSSSATFLYRYALLKSMNHIYTTLTTIEYQGGTRNG